MKLVFRVSQNLVYVFGGPHNKDGRILGLFTETTISRDDSQEFACHVTLSAYRVLTI